LSLLSLLEVRVFGEKTDFVILFTREAFCEQKGNEKKEEEEKEEEEETRAVSFSRRLLSVVSKTFISSVVTSARDERKI